VNLEANHEQQSTRRRSASGVDKSRLPEETCNILDAAIVRADVILPKGAIVTSASCLVFKSGAAGNVSVALSHSVADAFSVESCGTTQSTVSSGNETLSIPLGTCADDVVNGGLSGTGAGVSYFVVATITGVGTSGLARCSVTYTEPL
jgi:hypothetical protein